MGYSSYSHDAAHRLYSSRVGVDPAAVFTRTHARSIDPALDPMNLKLRESRDSADHPESNAIIVMFDETGSMGGIPQQLAMDAKKLPALMRLLVSKGYIPHPQLLFGAIGDATCDSAPVQVGQFESGLEMDDWLTKIFLEGNGGGQNKESYELAYYFAARHTATDCFEKRGKKGYLFTIGDEEAYPKVSKAIVKEFFGANIQADISLEDILKEVQEKWEVFHLCVSTRYPDGSHGFWKKYLGERALRLETPEGVSELIATTIGACEGRDLDDIHADLVAHGSDKTAADAARKAMVLFSGGGNAVAKKGTVTGELAPSGKGKAKRL